MKLNHHIKLFVSTIATCSIILLSLESCESESTEPKISLPPDVLTVSDIEGTVGFWDNDQNNGEVNKYFIGVFVPGSIDATIVGIVEDLPNEFRTDGLKVIFSGKYYESANNPVPYLGGQMIYSLELTSIETLD